MEDMAKYFNIAQHYLDSLYIKRDFNEITSILDDACIWLGPCEGERIANNKTICAYFIDVLKKIERCFITNVKCEVITQGVDLIVLIMTYGLHCKMSEDKDVKCFDQHCTLVIKKDTHKIVHINTSNAVQSIMDKGDVRKVELLHNENSAILRVVEEMNEIIQMIDANQQCGLKGSNDDEMFSYYYVNEGLYRMLGYTYDEFMEMSGGTAVGTAYPPDLPKALDDVAKCFAKGDEYSTEYRVRKKDGSLMWVIDSGRKHVNKNGEKQINSILMDITQLKQSQINLQVERERYRIALENITDVMFEYDVVKDCLTKYVKKDNNPDNPVEKTGIENYMNYLERENYIHLDDVGHLKALLIDEVTVNTLSMRMYHRGEWRWIEVKCTYIYEDEKASKCIGIWKDITDEKMTMEHLIDLSLRDPLTSLYHQKAVEDKIQTIMDEHENCAMLVMDIDKFKTINDTYGHLIGNDLLLEVKDILQKVCSTCEYVCRIGGDEFLVFLKGDASEKAPAYAKQVLEGVKNIRLKSTCISISIGIAYANKKDSYHTIFEKADGAMYLAKKNGRNRIEIAE